MSRPRDGVVTKFVTQVMPKVTALTPDFTSENEARRWYATLLKRAWFQRRVMASENPDRVSRKLSREVFMTPTNQIPALCTFQAEHGRDFMLKSPGNPLQLLHLIAHIMQPEESAWHGGEFSRVYLDLIAHALKDGQDIRRAVKDIFLDNKIKTSTRGPEAREKQRDAYYMKKGEQAVEGGQQILRELAELRQLHGRP